MEPPLRMNGNAPLPPRRHRAAQRSPRLKLLIGISAVVLVAGSGCGYYISSRDTGSTHKLSADGNSSARVTQPTKSSSGQTAGQPEKSASASTAPKRTPAGSTSASKTPSPGTTGSSGGAGSSGGSGGSSGGGSGGSGSGGTTAGSCTDPIYTGSNAEDTWSASNGDAVNNNAWNGGAGPQTIDVCNYNSWYVESDQPNDGGAIETYPDTEEDLVAAPYSCAMPDCGPVISSLSSVTSTFGMSVPSGANLGYDAAYDTWVDGLNNGNCEEVMVWNQYENDLNGYTPTYTNVGIGGTTWDILWENSPAGGNCGYVAFIMTSQESSGSVNLLAIYDWVIANHPGWFACTSTAACKAGGANPAELSTIEYGVEIAYTDGRQRFGLTNFSVTCAPVSCAQGD